ncbi:MAG: phage head closure protein [Gammaproteobacteria bacterium]|nr:phage head closure protein [Gammaproteobacteria bacterium]
MKAGKLIHRVTIQEPFESKGSMGGTTKTWVNFHKCWADVRELSGREVLQSEQLQSKVIATCFIRYKGNLDASMRLLHGDRIYQIESVINKDGKSVMLELPLYEFR